MPDVKTVKVAVENVAFHFDKAYDYRVPNELLEAAECGCRVIVPFGKGNSVRQGIIIHVGSADDSEKKLKSIISVTDKKPLLTDEMIEMMQWLKEQTFCTLFEAYKVMVPAGLSLRVSMSFAAIPETDLTSPEITRDETGIYEYLDKTKKYCERSALLTKFGIGESSRILENMTAKGLLVRNIDAGRTVGDMMLRMVRLTQRDSLTENESLRLSEKQTRVYELLQSVESASVREVCYFTGVTSAVVAALVKKGVAEFFESEVYRSPSGTVKLPYDFSSVRLNDEQSRAFRNILARCNGESPSTTLLYGVTGSGKTQVYLKLIDELTAKGKSVLVMVPEIALTPQTLAIFRARYGSCVAVFHSALSLGERLDEWKRVYRGEVKIVVGTRSAVFAPLKNIGAIIIDEEQESTYKSEMNPRYDARTVAKYRCAKHNAALILASATPDIVTFARAQKGKIALETLNSRYAEAQLPDVVVVDMNGSRDVAMSSELVLALEENLAAGRQSILLINRRGYNTFVSCRACGAVVTCPNCSISMTYHFANERLMCHYCGTSFPFTSVCPECGKHEMRYSGYGTQRIEEELETRLPNARVLRMDADTTAAKYSHEKKLDAFAAGEYDILLGTQMVAKGLDFENVTLVGVVNADSQLYDDDFRSAERSFSLLTQVVGRSGRGKHSGRAIIQTVTPENELIRLAAAQDYRSFFESEIALRKLMIYPPFCDLCVVGFVGENPNRVRVCAKHFLSLLEAKVSEEYSEQKIMTLGPMPPGIPKISNKFRQRLIIKCKNGTRFRRMMAELLCDYSRDANTSDVIAFADINPENPM